MGLGVGGVGTSMAVLCFQITAVMVTRMMATEWNSRPGSVLVLDSQVYLSYGCQVGPGATAHRNDFSDSTSQALPHLFEALFPWPHNGPLYLLLGIMF